MLCICGVGKIIIVWVLCHCSLYNLFQFCTLLVFMLLLGNGKQRHLQKVLPYVLVFKRMHKNWDKQKKKTSFGEEEACPRDMSLFISQVVSLFLSLTTQLKISGHQRAVPSPADHLSGCLSQQPCPRPGSHGLCVFWF